MAGKFFFQHQNQLFPVFPLPFRLPGIIAKDIAPPPFAITDDDFLGLQIVPDRCIATRLRKNLVFHFGDAGHSGGQQIFATPFL